MKQVQVIRIIDVAVIGPMMIWFSRSKQYPAIARTAMLIFGIGTIAYNGYNFIKEK